MTTAEHLAEARALITDPDAWGKPWGCDADKDCTPDQRLCPWRALVKVSGQARRNDDPATAALINAAGLNPAGGIHALFTWNDHPERTHAEVLAAFDRAIEATS